MKTFGFIDLSALLSTIKTFSFDAIITFRLKADIYHTYTYLIYL